MPDDSIPGFFGKTNLIGFIHLASSSHIVGVSPWARKGHSGTMERQSDASIQSFS